MKIRRNRNLAKSELLEFLARAPSGEKFNDLRIVKANVPRVREGKHIAKGLFSGCEPMAA